MRFKILLIVTPLLALAAQLFARPVFDSVGVENLNGKKIIIHKVEPKETYFAIGRRYGINPNIILNFNDRVPLQPGALVKVPTEIPFAEPAKPQQAITANIQTLQEFKVTPGETLYSIAKRFNTTVDDIKSMNGLTSNNLSLGQILKVRSGGTPAVSMPVHVEPIADPKPITPVQQYKPPVAAPPVNANNAQTTQDFKVSPGETLYSIAKRFNTTIDDIKSLNNLSTDNLTPGQILHVRSGGSITPAVQATVAVRKPDTTIIAARDTARIAAGADSSSADKKNAATRFGLFEKTDKGVGTWLDDDTGLDPNKKLVLHRTLPIGTIIKITNPMSNRTAFAKVVGRFNDNESTKDVIIVMTKNVAESLGALDKRFHVVITYRAANE